MNIAQAISIVGRISYKPGWMLHAERGMDMDRTLTLRVSFQAPDATLPMAERVSSRDIPVNSRHVFTSDMLAYMDESQLINRILSIIKQAEEHETLEFFQVDGKAPFYPH